MKARNRKILIVLCIAIVFAIFAGAGAYWLLNPMRTTIYVFAGDYEAGTQLTSKMLTAVEIDNGAVVNNTDTVAKNYIVTNDTLSSTLNSAGVLRTDVKQGDILTASLLSSTGGNAIEFRMKPDAVAVSVATDAVTSITNALAYGDRVNVYACYDENATLILQNQKVLAVQYENDAIYSVTLECSVEDSIRLIHANTYSVIQLGLVNSTGYQYIDGLPTYNTSGFAEPTVSTAPAAAAKLAQQPEKPEKPTDNETEGN